MKIPKGNIRKITGFMIENKDGELVFALNEIDFAYVWELGFVPRIFHDDKARVIYNELYKRFPK